MNISVYMADININYPGAVGFVASESLNVLSTLSWITASEADVHSLLFVFVFFSKVKGFCFSIKIMIQ